MNKLGAKIAEKRKSLGMTQIEFAEKMCVTRQTVSRWEAGTAMPDIDKISDIAELLGVSCDYLLKDDLQDEHGAAAPKSGISRLLEESLGRKIRLNFFEDEADIDLYNAVCTITDFEGSWMRVTADLKKGPVEKLISVSSVQSIEYAEEDA